MPDPVAPTTATSPASPANTGESVAATALSAVGKPVTAPETKPAATPAATEPTATPAVLDGEIKLTPPKDSGISEDHAKAVAEFAKANKLTQAQAEKVLERDATANAARTAAQQAAATEAEAAQLASLQKVAADGSAAWAKDPDFGGAKLAESNINVGRMLSHAPPEIQKWLTEHPLGKAVGSDPAFLRWMASEGAAHYREDSGNGATTSPASPDGGSLIDRATRAFAGAGTRS